jgi:histidinol-phosphate/aromatic aminotransferase/cobyric acid decarboxylase-like protein
LKKNQNTSAIAEKGGGTFKGIKLLLCENPLPPIDEAITAGQVEAGRSIYYTDFTFHLSELAIPEGTTLAVIVNPNNPNGGSNRHPAT